ncbi:TPA: hypothetical protein OHB72_002386 [Escherichia coli]|nr:hypothetical protein [Shigella dysenteriae]HCQ1855913.1 hypothetical protein [Escherichia coli]
MTELTKEQLIEEAKLKIAIAKCHPNSGMARVEGELFKIALASLVAEPLVPVMYKGMKLLTKEGLELIRDGIAEATGLEAMCMADALLSGGGQCRQCRKKCIGRMHQLKVAAKQLHTLQAGKPAAKPCFSPETFGIIRIRQPTIFGKSRKRQPALRELRLAG